MPNIYYELVKIKKYKFLLGYTKDYVISNMFIKNSSSIYEFKRFLNTKSKKVTKNLFKSEFGLMLEYFITGKTMEMLIPVKIYGESNSIKVWEKIRKIPYGCLKTYTQFSEDMKEEKCSRDLINRIHNNKLAIIIPSYRIIKDDRTISPKNIISKCYIDLLKNEGHKLEKKENKNNKKIILYNIK